MTIHPENITGNTSAGALSQNTVSLSGMMGNVLVKPATASTTYDISITNDKGITVYERTSETGTLSEETRLPMRGIYTVAIANATANEQFQMQLMIHE